MEGEKLVVLEETGADPGADTYQKTTAYISSEDGDLVLAYLDRHPLNEKEYGREDYEAWLYVKRQDKDVVLLQLIKDCFKSHYAFSAWLDQKGINRERHSY